MCWPVVLTLIAFLGLNEISRCGVFHHPFVLRIWRDEIPPGKWMACPSLLRARS